MNSRSVAIFVALVMFTVWTFTTQCLEGRHETLLRPDSTGDRAVCAVVANLLIGTVGEIAALHVLARNDAVTTTGAGFDPSTPSALRLGDFPAIEVPLLVMAVVTLATLGGADRPLLRRSRSRPTGAALG